MTAQRRFFQAVAAFIIVMFANAAAMAQNFPSNVPPGLLEQLNRTQQQQMPYNPALPSPSPIDQVRGATQGQEQNYPNAPSNPTNPLQNPQLNSQLNQLMLQGLLNGPRSKLEEDYSRRAGTTLTQFGYDAFRNLVPATGNVGVGAIGDDYILGTGDELVITLDGQNPRSIRTRVDSEGRVVIPDLSPIPAAGRRFGDFRTDLEHAVSTAFLNTNVVVSVGEVRQVTVAILGAVMAPGVYHLGGMSSFLDAMALAQGVMKTGSLRRIARTRNGQTTIIDLYPALTGTGPAPDLTIADGDRFAVPPIGPTVAVSDQVVRPGIYELPPGGRIDPRQALELAGGPLRPIGNRFVRYQADATGRDVTTQANSLNDLSLRAGDILMVMFRQDLPVGSVTLDGHVRVPGVRSLAAAPDVRSLIGSYDAFLDNPYLLFGAIQTTDPVTRARRLVPINLAAIMEGRTDVRLRDGDVVIVLSVGDVNYLASADVQAVLEGKRPPLLVERIVTQNPRSTISERPAAPVEPQQQTSPPGTPLSPLTTQLPSNPQGTQPLANAFQQSTDNYNYQPSNMAMSPVATAPNQAPGAAPGSTGVLIPSANAGALNYSGTSANQPFAQPFNKQDFAQQSLQICRGLQQLVTIATTGRPGLFSNAIYSVASENSVPITTDDTRIDNIFPCPPIFDKYPELLPLLVENATTLQGEVRVPGPYPVVVGTPLSAVVSEAGGLARDVDLKRVEVTHFDVNNGQGTSRTDRELVQLNATDLTRVALTPGDSVRFNPVVTDRDNGLVSLTGEFRRPGFYDIVRGEHLSELIRRAGGYTQEAYPYGAVFTRVSVREDEARQFAKEAQQLQLGLPTALAHVSSSDQSQALVAAAQQIVNALKTATPVGRIVVEADPAVLESKPELDPLMQPGDSVFVPKRPISVAVSGEVLNATSLQFEPGAAPKDYIEEAGGFTQSAEPDDVFVILPDGKAQPVKTSFWNFTPVQVPPGSMIVVPKNLAPFDLSTFLKDSTQILSQLAISGASLAVISGSSTR